MPTDLSTMVLSLVIWEMKSALDYTPDTPEERIDKALSIFDKFRNYYPGMCSDEDVEVMRQARLIVWGRP